MIRPLSACLLALAVAAPLRGQTSRVEEVPAGYLPPAGMCRVWVDGVPAAQQPAPTDCGSAMRSRPARSRVLIGEGIPSGSLPVNAFNAGSAYLASPAQPSRSRPFADSDERSRVGGELCHADAKGYCDDSAPGVAGCVDANKDGKCDDARRDVPGLIEAGAFRAGSALSGICIDRNRDGKCDETWLAADVCLDKDGDGKCDTPMASMVKPTEPVTVKPEPAPAPVPEKPRKKTQRPE